MSRYRKSSTHLLAAPSPICHHYRPSNNRTSPTLTTYSGWLRQSPSPHHQRREVQCQMRGCNQQVRLELTSISIRADTVLTHCHYLSVDLALTPKPSWILSAPCALTTAPTMPLWPTTGQRVALELPVRYYCCELCCTAFSSMTSSHLFLILFSILIVHVQILPKPLLEHAQLPGQVRHLSSESREYTDVTLLT